MLGSTVFSEKSLRTIDPQWNATMNDTYEDGKKYCISNITQKNETLMNSTDSCENACRSKGNQINKTKNDSSDSCKKACRSDNIQMNETEPGSIKSCKKACTSNITELNETKINNSESWENACRSDNPQMTENSIGSSESCAKACRSNNTQWQWSSYHDSEDQCFCFNHLSSGFLSPEDCKNANMTTHSITRLWNLTCAKLEDEIVSKHLYLRRHDYNFLKGGIAQYECEAGYGFKNQSMPTTFNLTCQWNGLWNRNISDLPACEPLECSTPPSDVSETGSKLSYRILLNSNMSLFGTIFKMECPSNKYFINRIPSFEAVCQNDGNWTVNHDVGCKRYAELEDEITTLQNLTSNHTYCKERDTHYCQTQCTDIQFSDLQCALPRCPNITKDQITSIYADRYDAMLQSPPLADERFDVNSKAVFECIDHSESFRLTTARSGTLTDLIEDESNNYGSLPNITFYCNYDRDKHISSWIWIYNGQKHPGYRMPKCQIGCRDKPPPEKPPNVTRTWVYEKHWESKLDRQIPLYKCGEGLSFNLPGFKAGDAIQMQCKSSVGKRKSKWQHDRSKDDVKWPPDTLPECVYRCKSDPIGSFDFNGIKYSRNWTDDDTGIGAIATYTCKGNSPISNLLNIFLYVYLI